MPRITVTWDELQGMTAQEFRQHAFDKMCAAGWAGQPVQWSHDRATWDQIFEWEEANGPEVADDQSNATPV